MPKLRQCCTVTYDVIEELGCLSISKYFSVLYHELIYDIAIFYSLKGETCDKICFSWLGSIFIPCGKETLTLANPFECVEAYLLLPYECKEFDLTNNTSVYSNIILIVVKFQQVQAIASTGHADFKKSIRSEN